MQGFEVISKPTTPFEGQKTGTSGLRKKTEVFMQENYLANWIQSLFLSLGDECKGTTMGLGGDGRYFNKEAVQIILKLAAGKLRLLLLAARIHALVVAWMPCCCLLSALAQCSNSQIHHLLQLIATHMQAMASGRSSSARTRSWQPLPCLRLSGAAASMVA